MTRVRSCHDRRESKRARAGRSRGPLGMSDAPVPYTASITQKLSAGAAFATDNLYIPCAAMEPSPASLRLQ